MACKVMLIFGLAAFAVANLPLRVVGADESLSQRRARLEKMSDAEKTRLLRQKRRFDELTPEEQQHYRKLHESLVQDQHYDQLRGTLQRYVDWLGTLAPVERAKLSKLPADQRLARIKELVDAQATERFRQMVSKVIKSKELLSPQYLEVICAWTDKFLLGHVAEILATIPDNRHTAEMKTNFNPNKHIHLLRFCYFRPESRPFRRPPAEPRATSSDASRSVGKRARQPLADANSKPGLTPKDRFDLLPKPTPEDEAELEKRVSRQARAVLEKATSNAERSQIILNWMRAAALSRIMPTIGPRELDRFVRESLSREERERLESMPRDRMYHELRKLYFRKRFERGRRGSRSRSGPRHSTDSASSRVGPLSREDPSRETPALKGPAGKNSPLKEPARKGPSESLGQ